MMMTWCPMLWGMTQTQLNPSNQDTSEHSSKVHAAPPSLPSYQAGFSPSTYHLIKQGSPPLVLVSGEALQQQGALRVAESLVLSRPPDLNEVYNK